MEEEKEGEGAGNYVVRRKAKKHIGERGRGGRKGRKE